MDKKDECLFYDPYTKQYFYSSIEDVWKRIKGLEDIYSGRAYPDLTEDGRPCLELELKEEETF